MKTISSNPRKDYVKNADGSVTPVDGTVVGERKFSLTGTTDKMGITTAGSIAKGFIWGLVIGVGAMLALAAWKDRLSISYSK